MNLKIFRCASLCIAALPLIFIAGLAARQQTATTVLDRVFTAGQAEKGHQVYEASCIRCHEGNDPEGPTLNGRTFIDRWREDNLDVLFNYLRIRMPADDAGKFTDAQYVELVAYLLEINGYAAGARELTVDALPTIRFVGHDGPRPLPTNTLVRLIGCLSGSDPDWTLTQASDPVRSRQGTETSPEELKKSAEQPLGTQSFRLGNFSNIRFDFKPDPYKGHKVQVKGVLIRQSNVERISLTLLDSVAATCGQ